MLSGFLEGYVIARLREPTCDDSSIINELNGGKDVWDRIKTDLYFSIRQGLKDRQRTHLNGVVFEAQTTDINEDLAKGIDDDLFKKLSRLSPEEQKALIEKSFELVQDRQAKQSAQEAVALAREYDRQPTSLEVEAIVEADNNFSLSNDYLNAVMRLTGLDNINDLIDPNDSENLGITMRWVVIIEVVIVFLISGLMWMLNSISPWVALVLGRILSEGRGHGR
jgi:hypothetical protein